MSVNKIKIIRPTTNNYVDIPIEMKWDFAGHDDSISEYQKEMVKEIIGSPKQLNYKDRSKQILNLCLMYLH